MKIISSEKYIEKNLAGCQLYPITLIKLLLNKRRILNYVNMAANPDFEIRGKKLKLDNSDCQSCIDREDMCRQHISLNRIMTAETVAFDLDTQLYLCENEIFRLVGNKLVVAYCPHTKLIKDSITDEKVRKINVMTVEDDIELPSYKVVNFTSSSLMDQHISCWFDKQFRLVTIPNTRNWQNFCLIPNYYKNKRQEAANDK